MNAKILSIEFCSPKCFYCDNQWDYILKVEPIDSVTKELTGNLVELRVCKECRKTKLTAFEDRIRYDSSISRKNEVSKDE